MLCPKCKSDQTQVIDSREADAKSIRRRRECEKCEYRFTTYERIEPVNLTVLKRSGKIEPFDREKIIRGITIAAKDRIDKKTISDIADEVEGKLLEAGESQIPAKMIGNVVINKLNRIDKVSYLRFASVYKNFEDIGSFEEELEKLKK